MMKTVGIAVDNYKLRTFKRELRKKGYDNLHISKFSDEVMIIKIKCKESGIAKLQRVITSIEAIIKNKN